MYNELVNKIEISEPGMSKKQPQLTELLNQLRDQNDYASDISLSIKEKLIKFLNLPIIMENDKSAEVKVDSVVGDFRLQIKRQKYLNESLRDILSNLNEII